MSKKLLITYGDRISSLSLWWKAVFVSPFWGFIVLPLVGLLSGLMGSLVFQCAYTVVVIGFILYFIEDVLKRKIGIAEGVLFFGYRCYRLSDLSSIGLAYGPNEVLPSHLLLNFSRALPLRLKLTRLTSADCDQLLKTIENKIPNCKIDPTIRMLSKCRRIARQDPSDQQKEIVIPYKTRRVVGELSDTFTAMFDGWSRVGPILVCLLLSPLWLYVSYGLMTLFRGGYWQEAGLYAALAEPTRQASGAVVAGIGAVGNWAAGVLSQPTTGAVMGTILFFVIFSIARLLLRPNRIVMNREGLSLKLYWDGPVFSSTVAWIPWSDVVAARLFMPANANAADQWKVCLDRKDGKHSEYIDLSAVAPEDRVRLARGIERFAPSCTIESQLAESLLPKQERSYTELWLQSLTAPPERKNLEPLATGHVLAGEYEVIRRLGGGGQGVAYLCRKLQTHDAQSYEEVVLKESVIPIFVRPEVRQQAIERFQSEAQLLRSFDSDRVVKLKGYFIEDHRGYLVLEHIEGKTLRQLILDEGPLAEDDVTQLALQMCDILECLHENGIIHRDFTPDNLILSTGAKLKLIDFNVAQGIEVGSTGTVVGRHAYIPPEQLRGKPTCQSDLYAFGATLFFLLIGQDPEPISQLTAAKMRSDLRGVLDNVISRCTALSTGRRILDVRTVRSLLLHGPANQSAPVEQPISADELDLKDNGRCDLPEPCPDRDDNGSEPVVIKLRDAVHADGVKVERKD